MALREGHKGSIHVDVANKNDLCHICQFHKKDVITLKITQNCKNHMKNKMFFMYHKS